MRVSHSEHIFDVRYCSNPRGGGAERIITDMVGRPGSFPSLFW